MQATDKKDTESSGRGHKTTALLVRLVLQPVQHDKKSVISISLPLKY